MNKVYYVNFKGKGKIISLPRHHAMEVNWVNAIKAQVIDNVILSIIPTEVLFKISTH
jgi:hypothetical protein